eukprot:CAMPEP_0198646868 /NCGR_PEP_ID=MMETSP1467-20131203/2262_1 /TAXON_ID=1462469 /ORGANISM="unid. sp., Strain CCMP2135" /LENGTH=134 /DNA_ID=CAMNT_0044382449 /DNA_START=236 /DNA_END=640 /DNA_ORIENTATION=-
MKAHAQLPGSHVQEGQEFAEEVEVQEGLELAEADEVVVDVESRAVVVADLLAYDVPLLANLPLALGLVASAEACRRCRLCRVRGLSGISRGCVRAFVVDVLLLCWQRLQEMLQSTLNSFRRRKDRFVFDDARPG